MTYNNKTATAKTSKRHLEGAPEYDKSKVSRVAGLLAYINTALAEVNKATSELIDNNSDEISPDGMLGGRGYIMEIKEMKESLAEISTTLSNLRDTLSDELNNPAWGLTPEEKGKLQEIKEKADKETEKAVKELEEDISDFFSDEGIESDTEDEEEFPSMEDSESEEETLPEVEDTPEVKTASVNKVFIGSTGKEDEVSRKIASRVLKSLIETAPGR